MADSQSIIGKGAIFKGKISNASTIEINGRVEADIKSEKDIQYGFSSSTFAPPRLNNLSMCYPNLTCISSTTLDSALIALFICTE